MPRGARLDAPGNLDHVIVRGIEKRRIVIGLATGYGVALAEIASRVGVSTSAKSKIKKRASE